MNDCEFCKESFRDGCNMSLIEDELKVFNSAEMFLGVGVFITDNELELYLEDPAGDEILKRKVKIKYCPMCGRRLNQADMVAQRVIGRVTDFILKSEQEVNHEQS